ncbi:MAG TPA: hypothetical protein VK866_19730 [Acidimicrobiales bacterium]|nr:hypothetical protein [Acidimicrobiales bacterium]
MTVDALLSAGHRVAAPAPRFDHLLAMTDAIGTFEHAEHTAARRDHGYCTDDMARVLMVVVREPHPSRPVIALGRTAMRFLAAAQGVAGDARNRCDVEGRWCDRTGVEDCWGRSIAAFGAAANRGHDEWMRQTAMSAFGHAVQQRSVHVHAMAFAALGAADVLHANPHHYGARALLGDAIDAIGRPTDDPAWPWTEPRLTYANATLAEALLAAGHALDRPDVVDDGCALLGWLLARETVDGHLSPTPVGGSGPGDAAARFDQQPIEAAAMADACARAEAVTGDPSWGRGVDLAVGWFLGDNDIGAVMWDVETGGGYDGLHARGPNLNQGAESTLALISTLQHARDRSLAVR